ncbi:hypothetical protein HUU62_17185 [Rhodoferax sp. 4810]|uniref:Uncharacterized protein n=2 Tax=Thiospirillum jenense TaxID=1653858 RepID=A0A839HJ93_9GAMM|nr:hypothetical protein [Rhodoferax jenense]MBB1126072.1 hypothetical protein [Thiospirillum jenense]
MDHPEPTHLSSTTNATPAVSSVDHPPAASVATRRRLLKHALLAAPAILTLRSGAALARQSGCYAIANPTTDAAAPSICVPSDTSGVNDLGHSCSAETSSYCLGTRGDVYCTTPATETTAASEYLCSHTCPTGALVSAGAYASLGPTGRWPC